MVELSGSSGEIARRAKFASVVIKPSTSSFHWTVSIIDGPQTGACADLLIADQSIGRSSDNDIVVYGGSMPDRIGTLTCQRGFAGFFAASDGVLMNNQRLSPGAFYPLVPGMVISVGGTSIAFDPVVGAAAEKKRIFRQIGLAPASLFAGLALVALALLSYGLLAITGGHSRSDARAVIHHHDLFAGSSASPPMTISRALTILQTRVQSAGLAKAVRLRADNGTIYATGILASSNRHAWLLAQRWFDRVSHDAVPLRDHVTVLPSHVPPPVALGAVILMPIPMIVANDGTRYTLGATLPRGWRVDAIAPSVVVFSRRGLTIREHY